MATSILAPGTGAGNSSSFALTAGQTTTLALYTADGTPPQNLVEGQRFFVQKQASNSQWHNTQVWLDASEPIINFSAIGTFRVARPDLAAAGISEAVGVDRD